MESLTPLKYGKHATVKDIRLNHKLVHINQFGVAMLNYSIIIVTNLKKEFPYLIIYMNIFLSKVK
jgi:hypothetical protein